MPIDTGVTLNTPTAEEFKTRSGEFVLSLMDGTLSDAQVKWAGAMAVFAAYDVIGTYDGRALKVAIDRLQKIMAPTAPTA